MKQHFHESIVLLKSNIVLIGSIVLTVYLPLNIFLNFLDYFIFAEDDFLKSLKLYIHLDAIISPISVGAVIYVLNSIKAKDSVTYQKAMAAGFRNWFHLLATRFVAGLLIILGLVAFIIPGLILIVRYSLIDAVVILENAGQSQARFRSNKLTEGNRWIIFRECVVMSVGILVFTMLISLPGAFIQPLDNIYYTIFADCITDIISYLFIILLFLFYWEAKEREKNNVAQPLAARLDPLATELTVGSKNMEGQ